MSPFRVALAVSNNLAMRGGFEELSRVHRSVPLQVTPVMWLPPKLVVKRDVNDQMAVPPKVDVLEH